MAKEKQQAETHPNLAFLSEDYDLGPLPGEGSALVARLVPPRETLTDPGRLESFFTQISSLAARYAGLPGLAGGRALANRSLKKEAGRREARRAFLETETEKDDQEQNSREEEVEESLNDPYLHYRLKALSQRHDPQWDYAVSLEIAGSHRQVSFLLRAADPAIFEEVLGLLRHEYPYLQVQRLKSDPEGAYQAHRHLCRTGEGLDKWREYDPLLFAGDTASQVAGTCWLVLSEHSATPLEVIGQKNRGGERENSPLRSLLASLSRLQPGEVAAAQLLVFGPVSKEWVKNQEALSMALRAAGSEQAAPSPQAAYQRETIARRKNSHGEKGRSARRVSRQTGPGSQDHGSPLPWLILVLVIGAGIWLWQIYKENIEKPLQSGAPAEALKNIGLGLIFLVLALFIGIALWWTSRRRERPGEVLAPSAIETKISRPLSLAALRLVASVPLQPYLQKAVSQPGYTGHYRDYGLNQNRARLLFNLRNSLLEQIDNGRVKNLSPVIKPGVKAEKGDTSAWEMAVELAGAGAEERCDRLLDQLASGYAAFQSGAGNAFTPAPPIRDIEVFSSLHPHDWPDPERTREGFWANRWPFNTPLFDWLEDLGRRDLPREMREYPCLGLLNSAELATLWHLPGGSETYDFLERSGAKELGPVQALQACLRSPGQTQVDWFEAGLGLFSELQPDP